MPRAETTSKRRAQVADKNEAVRAQRQRAVNSRMSLSARAAPAVRTAASVRRAVQQQQESISAPVVAVSVKSEPMPIPLSPQPKAPRSKASPGWRHPDELKFIKSAGNTWNDLAIVRYLVDNAFGVPGRPASAAEHWTYIRCNADDYEVILPRAYRVPLLWVAKYMWTSLQLVLTADIDIRQQEWERARFEILHIARLCATFLSTARTQMEEGGAMDRGWRSAQFDRALRRYARGWLLSKDEYVRDFWKEFGEEEYADGDILKFAWGTWVLRGHKGFLLAKQEVAEGISAETFMRGLVVHEDSGMLEWVENETTNPPPSPPPPSTPEPPAAARKRRLPKKQVPSPQPLLLPPPPPPAPVMTSFLTRPEVFSPARPASAPHEPGSAAPAEALPPRLPTSSLFDMAWTLPPVFAHRRGRGTRKTVGAGPARGRAAAVRGRGAAAARRTGVGRGGTRGAGREGARISAAHDEAAAPPRADADVEMEETKAVIGSTETSTSPVATSTRYTHHAPAGPSSITLTQPTPDTNIKAEQADTAMFWAAAGTPPREALHTGTGTVYTLVDVDDTELDAEGMELMYPDPEPEPQCEGVELIRASSTSSSARDQTPSRLPPLSRARFGSNSTDPAGTNTGMDVDPELSATVSKLEAEVRALRAQVGTLRALEERVRVLERVAASSSASPASGERSGTHPLWHLMTASAASNAELNMQDG